MVSITRKKEKKLLGKKTHNLSAYASLVKQCHLATLAARDAWKCECLEGLVAAIKNIGWFYLFVWLFVLSVNKKGRLYTL